MPEATITTAADSLAEAFATRSPCEPIKEAIEPLGLEGAYKVQHDLTRRAIAAGRRIVGRKNGLTSLAVQRQLGVDQPDFGCLFADMAVADGDPIPMGRLIQPKAEAEIAFVLRKSIDRENPTLADVIDAIAYALPAIEIVDSRVRDWNISIYDTIADNASSGLFALGGAPKKIDDVDLRLCGAVMEKNGDPISFGCGAACLGNPLNAVLWLANKLVEVEKPLQEGDVVLSGALGPMITAAAGDRFHARVNGLGAVTAIFSDDVER